MSTPTNGSTQPCAECGTPAEQECFHSLLNGMRGARSFTNNNPPMATPTEQSAATDTASWQRSTSTPPRTLSHLIPPTPHLPHLNSFSLPSRVRSAEEAPTQDPTAASNASLAVITGHTPTHQDHLSQVTASNAATPRYRQSPVVGDFSGPQPGAEYHSGKDSKPYIAQPIPQNVQRSVFLTNTSQPRNYHPIHPRHIQETYQHAYNAAMASQYQDFRETVDPDTQESPRVETSHGALRFGGLPSNDDLFKATESAVSIFAAMQATNKNGAADPVRQEATRELEQHDELPKSGNLHRLRGLQTYFHDALTAEAYRGACRPTRYKADPTIPRTTEAKRAHVRTLVLAFNSVEHANDNQTMKQPFIDKRHDQRLVECLCWEILQATISRSEFEEPLMQSYDITKARSSPGITSFAQRFDAVVESMVGCKTICKHMYDAPYLNVVVDDPTKAKNRVDANRSLNAVKAKQMAEGKKAQAIKMEEDGSPTPPPKRKRTTRVTTPTGPPGNPFRRTQDATSTPPRSMPYGAHPAGYDIQDSHSNDASMYRSSPHDMDASPARIFGDVGKVEYPEQAYGRGQRYLPSQYSTGVPMPIGRDSHGNYVFPRQPAGMPMGPAPPGVSVPMQPQGPWHNPQFSAMSAHNVDFSPHGGRQQTAYNQDGSHFAAIESSEYDPSGSGYGSNADNESSPM